MRAARPNCTAAGSLQKLTSVAHFFCTPNRRASRTPTPQVAPLARPSVSAAPGSLSECFAMHQTRRFCRFTRLALLASPAARRIRPPGSQTHQEEILDACSAAMPPPALAAATAAATAAAAAAAAALPRASLPAAPSLRPCVSPVRRLLSSCPTGTRSAPAVGQQRHGGRGAAKGPRPGARQAPRTGAGSPGQQQGCVQGAGCAAQNVSEPRVGAAVLTWAVAPRPPPHVLSLNPARPFRSHPAPSKQIHFGVMSPAEIVNTAEFHVYERALYKASRQGQRQAQRQAQQAGSWRQGCGQMPPSRSLLLMSALRP